MTDLITIPLAATDVDWQNWGLPVTQAINDHETRISSFETGTTGRVVARHARTTTPSYVTTETGICWVGFTALLNHLYKIEVPRFGVYAAGSGYLLAGGLRYTTDGSTPVATSSPVVTGGTWSHYVANSSGYIEQATCSGLLKALANGTIKVMFTHRRDVGAGNCTVWIPNYAEAVLLNVIDLGLDPGSSGTNI